MGKDRSPWQGGRRAWTRLDGWHQDNPSAAPGHPDDGISALAALADVATVRHLLDQAELVAVRTARRHGKSWAEIATKLGVTRQSAWERWRELDEDESAPHGGSPPAGIPPAPAEGVRRGMRIPPSRRLVTVPNVIGMSWDTARDVLRNTTLRAVGPDPDGPPLAALAWPDGVITDQSPESGARVPPGSSVTLWVERGGGSGVREPRRPKVPPKIGRQLRDEAVDEAVG